MRSNTLRKSAVTALLGAAALVSASGQASAQETIRMATSWAGGIHLEYFAKGFANNADKLTQGKVKVQVFPAGTIGSPLKVTESVQKKIAPSVHHWQGYVWVLDTASVIVPPANCPGRPWPM